METNNSRRCIIMLCDYYPVYITWTLQIMLINVTYLAISVSNIPITPILCMPAGYQSLRYNTTKALIGWAHTQNDPCKASQCIVV